MRHRDAAERTLLTAIAQGADLAELADIMLCAVTDRPFADGGHALDFLNKAFECVDLIGREHAAAILPTVVGQLVEARGADEQNAWRHPLDLVALLAAAFEALPAALRQGEGRRFEGHAALADELLGDDPQAINAALLDAIRAGRDAARPRPGSRLCRGAAHRALRHGQRVLGLGHRVARVHLRQRSAPAARAGERSPAPAGRALSAWHPRRCSRAPWRSISRAS